MENSVKFDPGMGEFVVDFNSFINEVYSQLMAFKTIHQKRARYRLYLNKIQNYMKNNIAFYLGCLLWGYYIYNTNINSPKNIADNPFFNLSEEQKNEFDFMSQVNFIENYFDSFERDTLYYCGQKIQIPQEWKEVLSLYSEFLQLNNGFVSTKTTSDIVLPNKLKSVKFNVDINNLLQTAIKQKDLTLIFNIKKSVL